MRLINEESLGRSKSYDPRSRKKETKELDSKEGLFFEKLGALLKLEEAAKLLRVEVPTLRDWRYKQKLPDEAFVTINRSVRVRLDVLERWVLSQNP